MAASMKASHLKENVRSLETLPTTLREEARERAKDVIQWIEAASRTEWLPVELDVRLTRVLYELVGIDEIRRMNAVAMRASLGGPLLKPMYESVFRMFGLRPDALLRFVPRGWPMVYKDCGAIEHQKTGPSSCVIRLTELPEIIVESPSWAYGTAGAFEGLLWDARLDMRVDIEIDVGARTIAYPISWG